MQQRRVYLDHAATTPTDPRVVEAMLPYLTDVWGNPSSIYFEAREARKGLDAAPPPPRRPRGSWGRACPPPGAGGTPHGPPPGGRAGPEGAPPPPAAPSPRR